MTWFKVCDSMWSHPKTIGLSDPAVALWVRAGSYAGNHLTDGFVASHVLRILQGSEDSARELVEAGLWVEQDGGYYFHDWNEYQPTRAKVHDERSKTRERVAAYRAKKNDSSISIPDPSRPDPTRPVLPVTNAVSNAVTHFSDDGEKESSSGNLPKKRSTSKEPEGFAEFYAVYPRRVQRAYAVKAWLKAVLKESPQKIIDAARVYALSVVDSDPQFIPHPATWLNGEQWADEVMVRKPKRADTPGNRRMDYYEELLQDIRTRSQGAIDE